MSGYSDATDATATDYDRCLPPLLLTSRTAMPCLFPGSWYGPLTTAA